MVRVALFELEKLSSVFHRKLLVQAIIQKRFTLFRVLLELLLVVLVFVHRFIKEVLSYFAPEIHHTLTPSLVPRVSFLLL